MQPGRDTTSKNIDRNLAERNRRIYMKDLFSTLASLILPRPSKNKPPLHLLLDEATTYVKHTQERTQELQQRKEVLKCDENLIQDQMTGRTIPPVINLRILDSTLEVNLISGSDKSFLLREVISVLQEEGAQVVNVSYSTVGDRVFYTIHSQAISSRVGIDTSSVDEKLRKLLL